MVPAVLLATGLFIASVVQSLSLTPSATDAFAMTLKGTVLVYNVTGEPVSEPSDTFGLWNYLLDGPNPVVQSSQAAIYVQAQDSNDIVKALQFAHENKLTSSIMGSGHQVVGVQLLPNAVIIDTSNMTGVTVDADNEAAYVEAGAQCGDLLDAVVPLGLMWPAPHLNNIGVAGGVLGGGLAIGQSLWGASVDNVLGIDVVTTWLNDSADWDIVRINATSEPDLYWGMLGGGPLLATAVGFEVQLHLLPADSLVPTLTAVWPLPKGVEAFEWYYQWYASSPKAIQSSYALVTTPAGAAATATATNWDPDNTTESLEAMQGFAAEAMANGALEVMPGLSDPSDPASTLSFPDRAYYINDRFVETVPEELVESLVALYANATSPRSLILIESTDQLPEVANNATAFGYRSEWLVWVWPFWTRTNGGAAIDGDAEHIAWAEQGGDILDLYGEGHYLGMNRFDTSDSTETCFPADNWARLTEVKSAYDPHSLFRPLDYYRTDNGFGAAAADLDYANES